MENCRDGAAEPVIIRQQAQAQYQPQGHDYKINNANVKQCFAQCWNNGEGAPLNPKGSSGANINNQHLGKEQPAVGQIAALPVFKCG